MLNAFFVATRTMAVVLLIFLLSTTGITTAQFTPTPGSTLRLCYLLSGGIDDLGYTFSFNLGRLTAQDTLQKEFPDIKIESLYAESVFFKPSEDQRRITLDFVRRGCHVILGNGERVLGNGYEGDNEIPKLYPNISWVLYNQFQTRNTDLANRIFVYLDMAGAWYLAGIAAAREAKTCIGMVAAFEIHRNPNDAVNGFIKGIRSVNATLPLHVITTNSYYWPPAERRAASTLLDRNCEVIGHYTNPRDVDYQVGRASGSDTGSYSIGPHSNLQLYVGDTVLTATYTDWARIIIPIIRDVINTGRVTHNGVPHMYGYKNKGITTAPITPLASLETVKAFEAAKPLVDEATLFCGTTKLRDGTTIVGSGPGGCMTAEQREKQMKAFLEDSATHVHPQFKFETDCVPGTTFSYTTTGDITLVCTPCPANTFSTTTGSSECESCPNGTFSEGGATNCTTIQLPPDESATGLSTGSLVGMVVGPMGFLFIIVVIFSLMMRVSAARKNKNAPREGPLCLLFTDVESSTKLWQEDPKGMEEAIGIHHELIRGVIEKSGAYEVKTVGDSFMIAVSELVDGVHVALDIQTALQEATWPESFQKSNKFVDRHVPINGLKVRIGLHWCTDLTVKFEAFHNYYDYYGNDVNLSARIESQARGGQILVSKETLAVLEADVDFPLVKDELYSALFARHVELKGVDGTRELFTLLPVALQDRHFEPLEGHEKDAETASSHMANSTNVDPQCASSDVLSVNSSGNNMLQGTTPVDFLLQLLEGCSTADQIIILRSFSQSIGAPPMKEAGTTQRKVRLLAHHVQKEKNAASNKERDHDVVVVETRM